MDGLFFETSRFELPSRGPRGLWPFSRLGTRGTRRRLTCWSHVHRGQVKGAVMEGPCSVERRLLTGNLKWLHWLVVIHHLILPVGLLTSFKVPSRIGGISAPPQETHQQALAFPVGLGGLGRFPEKACFLVPGRASMDHRQNPGMRAGRGCQVPFNGPSPTDRQPPLSPSGQ